MSAGVVERPLTDQQRAALEARERSVSLAAGAGCGKTFVLTERFLLEVDPLRADAGDLQELVAITFTDAAAREMRDRIRRRCYARLQTAASADEAAAWQRLMRSMDAARISTIHSFCTQLLRSHAVEAGLDPQFEVLDAAAAELLKLETVDDRLRALLLARDEDILELAAKRGLDRLREDVAALAGPRAAEAIERWRGATPEEVVARWRRYFEEDVAPAAQREILSSEHAQALRQLANPVRAASDKLRRHLAALAQAFEASGGRKPPASESSVAGGLRPPLALLEDLRGLAMVQGVCTAKDWIDADDYALFRDACKAFRDCIDKSPLKKPLDEACAHEAAAQGMALLRLVADVTESLEAAKVRRNHLEFDDLLARAHGLLTDSAHQAIREQVARRTRLLMVDEFQDTNPLQVKIIQAFCGDNWRERGLFTVGDFKQSIYRFNGAEPLVSTRLREELPPEGRLSLTRNFRSQAAITDFVNAVFHDAFGEYEPLVPTRPQFTATPAVEFLWTPYPDEGDGADNQPAGGPPTAKQRRRAGAVHDARVEEARWIARRLVQLLKSPERLVVENVDGKPTPRRLRLGDVAILLRTLSDAQVYEEALREHGLDYYLAGGHAFYSQQEIYDILNLLRAVASSVDEIALAGALRSPLLSLTDETLFWLVQAHGSLNAALAERQPHVVLAPEEAAKVRRAAATLARLRAEKDRLLVADLLALALELTGYDAVLLTEFLGPRKAANIEKLVEQARALDRSSPGDLPGFITQLSEFVVRAPKEALAATQAEGDVIRIMTIHYAKGLEFPLVVLPDLDRQRNLGAWQPVLDVELGPLVPLAAEEKQGCIGFDLYRHIENAEDLDERKRLLYVACTRAADYLILSSSLKDPEKPKQDWLQLIDRQVNLADGALRRPLPPGYAAPQIRVITKKPRIDDEAASVQRGADLVRLVAKIRELTASAVGEAPRTSEAIPVDVAARRRFSFSQLTGQLAIEQDVVAADDDASDEIEIVQGGDSVDGRAFGRLVHAVLERVDFARQAGVGELCTFLASQLIDVAPQAAAVEAAGLVEHFLRSPRAAELAAAQVVRREVEFLLPWPSVAGDWQGRYLHGYIDCLYQDRQGRWRLLDYKTSRVDGTKVGEAAGRYEMQMLAYSLACEQTLGEPLAECALHLLRAGAEHFFAWDDAKRRDGIARISAAIQSLTRDNRQRG